MTNNKPLEKGQYVDIYTDPITRQDYEGKARLWKLVTKQDALEIWIVRFDDEPYTNRYRSIYVNSEEV